MTGHKCKLKRMSLKISGFSISALIMKKKKKKKKKQMVKLWAAVLGIKTIVLRY